MTPQGQLLTLKGPLFSGPVVAVSSALLDADLKPQVASSTMAQSGMWWYPLWLGKKDPWYLSDSKLLDLFCSDPELVC